MKKFVAVILFLGPVLTGYLHAQNKPATTAIAPTVEVYYFHPTERCPIDQAVEENTKKTMQSSFAKEIKDGTIKFKVVNTEDKSNAKLVGSFDINSQALYIISNVKGKESKTDLTKFAFDYGQSNPERFRTGLKAAVDKALK
jgi:hypothetical protein